MPAPVSSTVARTTTKLRPPPHNKKTRIVRRRGRAQDAIGSDDEIEREIGTDSESEDDASSSDSASDSDTEPTSEHAPLNGHSHILTRNTSQSPDEPLDVASKPPAQVDDDVSPFFGGAGNWSEMVADENVNGPAELPVIDFADFDGHTVDQHPRPRKTRGENKSPLSRTAPVPASPSTPSSAIEGLADDDQPIASSSRQTSDFFSKRGVSQTARQVYQQRLETDPSYVPTVGEFWGHDDRLLDKDLRSLSGWWRGRWQGRGRGRGGFDRGFHMRGRGRGAHFGAPPPAVVDQDDISGSNGHDDDASDVAPIERAWTHDGFEEMKRRDDRRRDQQQPQQFQGFVPFRGSRGGFAPARGRGAFARGGFTPSPTRGRSNLPFVLPTGRPWFAMKPERMWTKQHDAFLYFDPALKPRPGLGPGFRVQLPGDQVQIIRAPPRLMPAKQPAVKLSAANVDDSEDGENPFVVRIPKWMNKVKSAGETPSIPAMIAAEESVTTVEETSINDVFTVRPRLVERHDILPPSTSAVNGSSPSLQPPSPSPFNHVEPVVLPDQRVQQKLEFPLEEQTVDSPNQTRRALTEEAVLRHPQAEDRPDGQPDTSTEAPRPPLPVLPPLQTTFSPILGPSASYSSPYGYGQSLPPGIAVSQHGMPYEVATGRAVYLQPPPPPPPMYNPRPVVHTHMVPPGVPFVPGHMHNHSAPSPDFLSQPPSHTHTPPVNGFIDPSTGTPIFTPPRQSSRIEIRAPSEQPESKSVGKPSVRKPSGLRSAAAMFEPSQSASENGGQGYFPDAEASYAYGPSATRDDGGFGDDGQGARQQLLDPAIMGYSPYQQPYYYPEPYGYTGYMDMPQVAQYDMYPSNPQAPQAATVYY